MIISLSVKMQRVFSRKENPFFNTWCWISWISVLEKKIINLYLTPYTKINSNFRSKCKSCNYETYKQSHKSKKKKKMNWNLSKLRTLTLQKELLKRKRKTTSWEGKKCIWQRTCIQLYKNILQLKNNTSQLRN